jgi:hypothetical protein
MIEKIKKFWKYSKLRFYYKNAIWNSEFYLFSKKIFKDIEYTKGEAEFRFEKVKRHRFVGYRFKNNMYLDNPGFIDVEPDVWKEWKSKNYF